MNDDLQKALAEFVKATLANFQQGKDFVLAQAPDVIQQLIRWHFWQHLVGGVLLLIASVVGWICVVKLIRLAQKSYDGFGWGMGAGFAGGGCVFLTTASVANFFDALKIAIAPKVWLLEWAMAQVKK